MKSDWNLQRKQITAAKIGTDPGKASDTCSSFALSVECWNRMGIQGMAFRSEYVMRLSLHFAHYLVSLSAEEPSHMYLGGLSF